MKWPSFKRKQTHNRPTALRSDRKSGSDAGAYRAVAIVTDLAGGCSACEQQLGRRYLMSAAPSLPLKNCDAAQCQCRYVRYADRREEVRRDCDIGIGQRPHLSDERRQGRSDRRAR